MATLLEKLCRWANTYSYFTLLAPQPSSSPYPYGTFPRKMAVGAKYLIPFDGKDDFETLKGVLSSKSGPWFGHFTYDLKNQLESLTSSHPDRIHHPLICFYQPQFLVDFDENMISITGEGVSYDLLTQILTFALPKPQPSRPLALTPTMNKEEYLEAFRYLHRHIVEGDIYEINLCQEFQATQVEIDPISTFIRLYTISPAPFSCIHKTENTWLLCASPERFLKKSDDKIISQPIKGTARRHPQAEEDQRIKEWLATNEKERAENMMIVDLVRNDLARSAIPGTVRVEELFGIYSFPQVHQMISTVTAHLKDPKLVVDALAKAFPMGSMTGAPKIMAMRLIETYEKSKRGLFSGSVGYFSEEGDFDFNVVIRSVFYNQANREVSIQVGSAITYDAEAEMEYEECLLKARALIEALEAQLLSN
jgi:para-aminobenzoate synthetase component I